MEERLQKILAHAGVGSRRECEKLIEQGLVTVDGERVTELGIKLDPAQYAIKVDGTLIRPETLNPAHQYVILHKPKGFLTTVKPDPKERPTIMELLNTKVTKYRVYPVGRLDFNTEGLVLLTNDGELANRLTHPHYKVPKTYEVKVQGIPPKRILDILASGVNLEDGRTLPARVKLLRATGKNAWLLLTIFEGRNRQIRRMCDKVRFPVLKLRRVKIGPLRLTGLPRGQFRFLTDQETLDLKHAVKLT